MKINNIKKVIISNKKILICTTIIFIIGLSTGSIFANIINQNDKTLVIDKINTFINNINSNNIDISSTLKNSLSINLIYTITIWTLGFTIIGIIFSIILLFFKSFIIGFTLSSFILTYTYKGIILSLLYFIFIELINIIAIFLITISSIKISIKLIKTIITKTNNIKNNLKKYLIILLISIFLSIIASLIEVFLFPSIIKLIIKLFI